jgi:hypothetical protein
MMWTENIIDTAFMGQQARVKWQLSRGKCRRLARERTDARENNCKHFMQLGQNDADLQSS